MTVSVAQGLAHRGIVRSSVRGNQRQFLENICSEDDLNSRSFGTFVVKFLAYLPLLGFSNPPKHGLITHF